MARLTFRPVTSAEWRDLVALFGPRGACAGCWCMWWRLTRKQFEAGKGGANRRALKKLIDEDTVPGILACDGERPVGWCSVAPRVDFPALERSRVLARVDDAPVWSIVCFFVAKDVRRSGVTGKLIQAAVSYARKKGARIVEAYPVSPGPNGMPDVWAYTGLESAFARAGFTEAARRSPRRAVWRFTVSRGRPAARS
jgi:GNAT superfamily N-acetyltransferase